MYTIVRRIKVKPGQVDEAVRRIREGLLPLLRREPGFLEFYLVQIGATEGLSISVFATGEQAEAGNRRSVEWAREHIFPLAEGAAEVVGLGGVLVHERASGA